MSDWSEELSEWLKPFLARLGHKARRRMCPLYVAGLIGPGDRKSVGPMAERLAPGDYDQLHHFVSSGVWDAAPLEEELARQADALVGGPDAVLVIDDTSLPKKGQHSVGVAPQYASALGKTSNCQSLVSVTLASREVPVMMGLRLFLPEIWTDDPGRMTRARVPKDRQVALTKLEIAIDEIDRVVASGARFGCVLADAGYGSSGTFRQALSERGLLWAVGLSRRQNVYPADVALIFPVAKTGKRRQYHIPDHPPISADAMLAGERWQKISWRRGTRGRLAGLFAARRVRVADAHKHRMLDNRMQCMPGRRGLACRRAEIDRGAEVLCIQPASRDHAQEARGHHQGEVDLRAGASATQGGTRPRPFRRPILDRITPTCPDDHDRLRLSSIPPPQGSGAEKKESEDHLHNPVCRPSGGPFSTYSHDPNLCDVLIVKDTSRVLPNPMCQSSASCLDAKPPWHLR